VIVVIGSPVGRLEAGTAFAAGLPARVALTAAAAGRQVQLLGKVGDDPIADGVLLDLSRGGVAHAALLRDVAHATPLEVPPLPDPADPEGEPPDAPTGTQAGLPLDAADVDLGLRYLTTFDVLIVAGPAESDVVSIVAEAARWAGARLVLVAEPGATLPGDLPPDAIAFEAPATDPDGAFASLAGALAAALDDGAEPGDAFRSSIAADGWTESEAD